MYCPVFSEHCTVGWVDIFFLRICKLLLRYNKGVAPWFLNQNLKKFAFPHIVLRGTANKCQKCQIDPPYYAGPHSQLLNR